MHKTFLIVLILSSLLSINANLYTAQSNQATVTLLDREDQATTQITDGDTVRIRVTLSQPVQSAQNISFTLEDQASGLDFSRIFYQPRMPADVARHHCEAQDHGLAGALDHQLLAAAAPALDKKGPVRLAYRIRNANRSVGAMLSGVVARKYGHAGLADDSIHVAFDGTAGQSFGAFLARGITFELQGATNDYVGKGLSGGRIVVYPDPACPAKPQANIVMATR